MILLIFNFQFLLLTIDIYKKHNTKMSFKIRCEQIKSEERGVSLLSFMPNNNFQKPSRQH